MPIALVQVTSGSGSGTSLAVAFGSNNTLGNFLAIGLAKVNGGTDVVTDSNNTPVNDVAAESTNVGGAIWSVTNCAAGANTVTAQGAGSMVRNLSISEWSGLHKTSPIDKTSSGFITDSSSPTCNSGATATLSQADELCIGLGVANNQGPFAPGAGWTEQTDINTASVDSTLCSKIVAATTAQTFTATAGGDNNWVGLIATYKMAAYVERARAPRSAAPQHRYH